MAITNFWSTQNVLAPAAPKPVIADTPGDDLIEQEGNPLDNLPGGLKGLPSAPVVTVAEKLFPTYDAHNVDDLPADMLPANFTRSKTDLVLGAPDYDFTKWHSAVQIKYLIDNKSGTVNGQAYILLGPAPVAPAPDTRLTAVLSKDDKQVFIVDNLQKTDIAKLSKDDQKAIASTAAFTAPTGLAALYQLSSDADAMKTLINQAINQIDNPTVGSSTYDALSVDGKVPAADREVFKTELRRVLTSLDGMSIFSLKDIKDAVTTVMDRYKRANAFAYNIFNADKAEGYKSGWSVASANLVNLTTGVSQTVDLGAKTLGQNFPFDNLTNSQYLVARASKPADGSSIGDPGTSTETGLIPGYRLELTWSWGQQSSGANVTSLDGGAGYKAAYRTFMDSERQISALAAQRVSLAAGGQATINGKVSDQSLDVPNLVFLFQLYTNLTDESRIRADTEEISQTNNLLRLYSVMQRLVNETTKEFNVKEQEEERALGGVDGTFAYKKNTGVDFTAEERKVVDMFNTGTARVLSPMEILKGITDRPNDNLKVEKRTGGWSGFGQTLADTVTLLNQDSQLKMNDVNSLTKQKDRHFELANNSLSKMNEIVQKIAGTS